jgi:myo-inositol-1(or 4)-monophosphatase
VSELGETCLAAAQAGARVLRELYHRPREIHLKGRIDLVTDADRAAEETVLRLLQERAPGVRVLAEESGEHGKGNTRFIVDPLDGTTNYAHGLPLFACTVAAESLGVVVAGCTVDPMRDETYLAARGEGAVVRSPQGERRLRVSEARELEKALVCTGFPYGDREKLPSMLAAFSRFTELAQGSRRLGSAALDLAWVAAGRLDGYWERNLKPWDMAAGLILVREAGGFVTDCDGGDDALAKGHIVAGNEAIQKDVVRVLKAAGKA